MNFDQRQEFEAFCMRTNPAYKPTEDSVLVSERIAALKLYAQNIDKAEGGEEVHDAICRDLILPCVYTLTQFLESVTLEDGQ